MASPEPPRFDVGLPAEALLHVGDLLDAGVLTLDADLVVRGWNRWLEVASGWSASEVVGRPLLSVFPDLEETRAEGAFRKALDGEMVVLSHRFHKFLLPLPPGPAFPGYDRMQQSARIAPIFAAGQVKGAVALIHDVTERVAREAALRDAMEQAERASAAKSEFIAAMSHELRTPLGAIIGYSELLETEVVGPLSDPQKDHMRRLKAGAWHLMGIIEEILSFSRVEAGGESLHREPVDLVAVAEEALSLVGPQAREKRIAVRFAPPGHPAQADTDAGKVRQILVNLLGNAVKFTDEGEVELRLWEEPDRVCFRVRDTGPGIPDEYIDRIFEPFTQVSSAKLRARGGTGLGLPVSQRLARLLGGDLELESTAGEGSCFRLVLPRRAPGTGEEERSDAPEPPAR